MKDYNHEIHPEHTVNWPRTIQREQTIIAMLRLDAGDLQLLGDHNDAELSKRLIAEAARRENAMKLATCSRIGYWFWRIRDRAHQ